MLLTIMLSQAPATDLGYLLHKHPDRLQTFPLPFGQAHVFYPEARHERCTAALLLEIDPIGLVRGRGAEALLANYVNDRPYVASSFLSVALAEVFRDAMAGKSKERPELARTALPLEASLAVLPCRGGEGFLCRLFEPLGYAVNVASRPLDPQFPEWGESRAFTVTLSATCLLSALLTHLYVLVPVLDDEKHYWVGDDEVEKLLRRGAGWLSTHPARDVIAARYLRHQRGLVEDALARLTEEEMPAQEGEGDLNETTSEANAARVSLHSQRLAAVHAALKAAGARHVLDLGCGEGRLLALLLADAQFERVTGMDVSYRALQLARRRLRLDRLGEREAARITLLHGALTYRDHRLEGYDAAAVVEVIEHLDPPRLAAFERVLFAHARPGTVVLTTPNREYNARFPGMQAGGLRHADHRFEWTRAEFAAWVDGVVSRHGYAARIAPVGPEDAEVGAPSQMAVFKAEAHGMAAAAER